MLWCRDIIYNNWNLMTSLSIKHAIIIHIYPDNIALEAAIPSIQECECIVGKKRKEEKEENIYIY